MALEDFISDAEQVEIRNELNNVTQGTFYEHDITYVQNSAPGTLSLDRWSEERTPGEDGSGAPTNHALKCFIEYETEDEGKENKNMKQGSEDISEIEVSFNVDALEELGLYVDVDKVPVFNKAQDYFIYAGKIFRLRSVEMVGPFTNKFVIAKCKMKAEEKNG